MTFRQNVLICYRGRYRRQVELLAGKLRARGFTVTYDHEVLANPGAYDATEVEWMSLAPEGLQEVTSWRGPLKQTIGESELTVFLVDPQDQSNNVINEISWVARSGRHAFFVMDTRVESVSPEAEGIAVSFINIICAAALGKFEVPEYEHLLFAHQDPNELEARLDVAVNRIHDCLERIRHQPPRVVRFDEGVTHVSDIEKVPVVRARRRLNSMQEEFSRHFRLPPPPHLGDPYQEALEYIHRYEKGAKVEGNWIRSEASPFRYDLKSERARFARTQEIVDRVRPGEYEEHPLFALLARQAASVELILEAMAPANKPFHPAILLGTLPFTAVDDVSSVSVESDYAIILLDRAFIQFLYRIIKVSVLAWKPMKPPGQALSSFSMSAEDVIEIIDKDKTLEEAFFRCVNGYLLTGFPGPSVEGDIPRAYQIPLSALLATAERFMIARGYAQLALMDPEFPAPAVFRKTSPRDDMERTVALDFIAVSYVIASAARLDGSDPEIAIQGCGLPLVCLELIDSAAAALAPTTHRAQPRPGRSLKERLSTVENAYAYVVEGPGVDLNKIQDRFVPGRFAWQTPQLLWERVAARFEQDGGKDRLAWIWR